MHRVNEKQLLSSGNGINIYPRLYTRVHLLRLTKQVPPASAHNYIYAVGILSRQYFSAIYVTNRITRKGTVIVPFLLHYINFNYAAVAFSLFEASAVAASSFVELDCEELSYSESLYLSISSFEDFS